MPITAKCPNAECGKTMKVKDEFAGRKVKCPACASVFLVPMADGAAAPQPQAVKAAPRPAAAPAPVSVQEEVAPAPSPAGALDQQTQLFMFIGLGLLVLLAVSPFLAWISYSHAASAGGLTVSASASISGIKFLGGWAVLLLALGAAGTIGTMFALKKPLAPFYLLGGAVGTACLLTLLRFVSGGGLGMWLGLLASLGVIAMFVLCSIRTPYQVPFFKKEGTAPFLQKFGGLLIAQGGGLLLGIILFFIGISGGGMPSFSGNIQGPGGRSVNFDPNQFNPGR